MTNMDKLLEKPDSMKAWICKSETRLFLQYLLDEKESLLNKLLESTEPHEIFALQGELRRIAKIFMLIKFVESDKRREASNG